MTKPETAATPKWYWAVAGFALFWNLLGCAIFLMELFAQEQLTETWTDEQKAWAEGIPTWIYFEYGIAVVTGTAGSVLLLLKNSWSIPLMAVCSLSVIVQMVYTMLIAGGLQVMGVEGAIMPCLVIILSIVFLWFSIHSKQKGWIA